jgi:cytochrome c-type biogenesis protein CcmH
MARTRSRAARAGVVIMVGLTVSALAFSAPAAAAPRPGLTVTGMETDFMCVVCHEALNVAQAPEADQERAEIGRLIAQGESRAQIDSAMVAQYGSSVLAEPKAQGFNVVLYVLPPALVLAGVASLAVLLPRWRRRARADAAETVAAGATLDAADAKRLDEELARYDG